MVGYSYSKGPYVNCSKCKIPCVAAVMTVTGEGAFCEDCYMAWAASEQACGLFSTAQDPKPVGKKFDEGKLRFDLVPESFTEVVACITYGAKKYGDENWREVENPRSRYFAAAMRHAWSWFWVEENDADSGLSHLAHAVCCMLILMVAGKKK